MNLENFTADSRRFWPGEEPWTEPLAIIDLDKAGDEASGIAMPECPVLGVGDIANPLAKMLDAVIETPFTIEAIAGQVLEKPLTAAAIVGLLRIIGHIPLDHALWTESVTFAMLQGSGEHREWMQSQDKLTVPALAGHVILERNDSQLIVTLDRAAAGNAIDRPMRDALGEAFTLAGLDTEIEQVLLRANGKPFSLGAELGEFGTTIDPATAHVIRRQTLPARAIAACADKLDVHIDGACVGAGLEMAAFAKRVTATRRAWFQLPELAMGILPGAGGCVSLTRRLGRQRAALLILSGKRLGARAALDLGLVDAIVDEPA